MLTMMFSATLVIFAAMSKVAIAAPSVEARDVYAPVVTYPHHGTIWYSGQRHNVTWDASHPPKNITNPQGQIWLRKGRVTTNVILAKGFNLTLGRIEVTVPWVKSGTNYQLVLFGDSGNTSQDFSIKN